VSHPSPVSDGAAAAARAELPESEHAAFDRLAGALLSSSTTPLGPLLRAQLPGTAGVRWLSQEGLPSTTRPAALAAAQWISLFRCWTAVHRAPGAPVPGGRGPGRRPATHGHAPGAMGKPRWGQ
jgi:hypothetical protein